MNRTLVLLDGITVYNPTHAFGFFSTFNNDVVDDLTLYKGAYPATYGGRLGAVLDVGLRRPESSETRGKIGVSLIAARVLERANVRHPEARATLAETGA